MRKKLETYILANIQNHKFKIDEIVDLKIRTYFVSISLSYLFICRSTVAQLNGNERMHTHCYRSDKDAKLQVTNRTAWRIILLAGDTKNILHSQNDRKQLK